MLHDSHSLCSVSLCALVVLQQLFAHIDARLSGLVLQAQRVAPGKAVQNVPLLRCVAAQLLQPLAIAL